MDAPNTSKSSSNPSLREKLHLELANELIKHTNETLEGVLKKLQTPKNPTHGDVAYPVFEYAKLNSLPPPVASEKLRESLTLPVGFQKISTAGPFLNFSFEKEKFVEKTLDLKFDGKSTHSRKVIVEYSSPNIAKPFHVGHLRATLVGNALDKTLRFLGEDVVSINHLGDWGTQFGFVWAGCELWGRPESPTVRELVELYKRATKLKADQELEIEAGNTPTQNINEMARGYFRDLEEGKEYAVNFWKWCLDISMVYFLETYGRLGVRFDHYTGESFYSDKLETTLKSLKEAGVLEESKGALGVNLGEELGFARVATPDGRSLYLTRDIAAANYRADTFNFDEAVYVVGAPQTLHFQQIKGVLSRVNPALSDKIVHVPFGTVLGIKTRGEGEFVELNDFLDEATSLARQAYSLSRESKEEAIQNINEDEVCDAVGLAAIIFSTLRIQRQKDVQFNWETAMVFNGDSGPYLLYAVARINSIEEKAKAAGLIAAENVDSASFPEDEAFRLAMVIDDFYPTLRRVAVDKEPSYLCSYALELSYAFSKAYQVLRVLGEEKTKAEARLALFIKARETLKKALELIGFKVIERM